MKIRWLSFKNTTGETIPAYAAMVPTGSVVDSDEISIVVSKPTVQRPDCLVFNGPQDVPDQEYGRCSLDFPLHARAASVLSGATLSPTKDSWDLTADDCGPFCVMAPTGTEYAFIERKYRHITGVGSGC